MYIVLISVRRQVGGRVFLDLLFQMSGQPLAMLSLS
jgi:hypothetical protein